MKGVLRKIHGKMSEILILILCMSSFLIPFPFETNMFHMLTNGDPIFNFLLGVNVRKSTAKLLINPSSGI
jgi:hypothetical protein